jgi:predicted ATPase/class 3 adenylate cyclase
VTTPRARDVSIAGYRTLEPVDSGPRTRGFHAQRERDGAAVLLRVPHASPPSARDLDRLRLEYELLQSVGHPGVPRALALEIQETDAALVLEWRPGRALAEVAGTQPMPLDLFLQRATAMAAVLSAVHEGGVVHKHLTPQQFLVAPDGAGITLTGFDLASRIPRQAQSAVNPDALEGTLAYMSPEQTGRMNRSIDFRTDLYSLGVVFYEMLTGTVPFTADDPMQLVHQHIARQPRPVHERRPEIPAVVSRIVQRLLAKSADERYQSATGLEADLRRAWDAVRRGQPVPEFSIGAGDVPRQFRIPERLYGRAAEVQQLVEAFERLGSGGPQLFVVAGYSGIGKSSLVNELQRPAVARRGYFVAGKFDQFKRNVPFASLIQALRDLVRQILTEDDERIAEHRHRLLDAVGPNGQLVLDVVPELALILGPQPAVPELPAREARNRFQRVLHDVVRAFAGPTHPLCLFLDDLQWVDGATLDWLETTLADTAMSWLFLVAAYRDHEVPPSHPLALSLARLRTAGVAIEEATLAPLDPPMVEALVSDTLHGRADEARPLAQLVHEKTRGNPFFVNQFLTSLHQDGAIAFAGDPARWTYDLARASAAAATDNVVEFMSERIRRLPREARDVLTLAACVGSTFDLATLLVVSERDRATLLAALRDALTQGFVLEAGGGGDVVVYRFLHDRVQQAAYALMSDAEAAARRLRIGRLMRANSPDPAADERLFDMLQHLDFAAALITDNEERRDLAQLNLAAAGRARAATAFGPALHHVRAGMELARLAGVGDRGPLAFALALERAECEHLNGHDDEAERFFTAAFDAAADDFERGRVYEKRIHFYTNQAQFRRAYDTGLDAARMFGISLPRKFVPPLFVKDLVEARLRIRGRDVTTLVDLPTRTDERGRLGVRFMAAVSKAAFQIRPELCVAICTRIVNESLAHGLTADTVIGYLAYGVIFSGGILGNPQAGLDYGRLVLSLIDKFDNRALKAEVNFVYGYFAHSWSQPLATTEEYFRAAYQAGVETGDHFHASCACAGITQNMLMRGAPVDDILAECDRRLDFLTGIQAHEPAGVVLGVRQALRNLQGRTAARNTFDDDGFDETEFERTLGAYGSPHFAHCYVVDRLQAMVLWGERDAAQRAAAASAGYLKGSAGLQQTVEHHFWSAMLAADAGDERPVRRARRRLHRWARHGPANYRHRALLLDAESARLRGERAAAADAYDHAIDAAIDAGFVQHEGLALERAGRFAQAQGRRATARHYLDDAAAAYARWGATAVAESLHERVAGGRPTTGRPGARPATPAGVASPDPGAATSAGLDLATVVKSSQAISGEVQLPLLLQKLLAIVMENAGAERGVLLVRADDTFVVRAEGRVGEEVRVLPGVPLARYEHAARGLVHYVMRTGESVVVPDATRDPAYAGDPHVVRDGPRSLLATPLVNQGRVAGILYLENNLTPGAFTAQRMALLSLLSTQIAISLDNAVLYEHLEEKVTERTAQLEARNQLIRQTFGRYLSDDIVRSLLETSAASHLGGEKRRVTILMSDLRGFTSMAERLPPEKVVSIINNYLAAMTDVIMKYRGTIDEFIGDAILAIFGAPTLADDDADRAVACALEMQRAITAVNERNRRDGLAEVTMGIGLNTGEVVVGSIGSEKRAKYGVVGAHVNLASRIQGYTAGGEVLVSDATRAAVRAPLRVDGEQRVHPKGVSAPITVYTVGGIGGAYAVDLPAREPA